MATPKEAWRALRGSRPDPPGQAAESADRRKVFQASLAQSEELWDAAAAAGPASRPLPLFYCLSQAARALCAAWDETDSWQPRAHGLGRVESPEGDPAARTFAYGATVVSRRSGAFAMMGRATGSPTFAGVATVADFWAALPGFPTPRAVFGDAPRCISLSPVYDVPGDERPAAQRIILPTHGVFRARVDPAGLPNTHPTTQGLEQDGVQLNPMGAEQPIFKFPRHDGTLRPLSEVGVRAFYEESLIGDVIVRPKVGEEVMGPPTEFLTLWGLMFCLSELARYYPDIWVGVLDPNESAAAVTIEHGLDLALERSPQLIAEAIHGPSMALLQERLRLARGEGEEAAEVPQ